MATATASLSLVGFPVTVQAAVPQHYVTRTITSPHDRVGLELYDVRIGTPARPVVAIRRVLSDTAPAGRLLLPGLVNRDYSSAAALTARVKAGPFPVTLVFENLALGGDALAGDGTPLVTAADALNLAQELAEEEAPTEGAAAVGTTASPNNQAYRITILHRPSTTTASTIQSRRGDVLEINYHARLGGPTGTIYDASTDRGTGQPYQMVLGSGDMMNGVDQGLYDMGVGEVRLLQIPPFLAYGRKGNQMFHIPPDATLYWQVELVAINSLRAGDARSRDEIEERVPYD
jgi:FKBP-type peptidyl-prolyl cis-trans isomerase